MSFDRRNTLDDDDDDDAIDSNIGMTVKAIVLDDGFWQSITEILHVAMPIIKLLAPHRQQQALGWYVIMRYHFFRDPRILHAVLRCFIAE